MLSDLWPLPTQVESPFKGHKSLGTILEYWLLRYPSSQLLGLALQTVHSCYKVFPKGNMELHITNYIKKNNKASTSASTPTFQILLPSNFWVFLPLFSHTSNTAAIVDGSFKLSPLCFLSLICLWQFIRLKLLSVSTCCLFLTPFHLHRTQYLSYSIQETFFTQLVCFYKARLILLW